MQNNRQKQVIALMEDCGEVDVATLVRNLRASEATIRRDLHVLEEAGLLVRTFGGARTVPRKSLVVQTFDQKSRRMRQQKECVARAAAELVRPGMVVALDGGTAAWRVAAALKEKGPLTIITAALAPVEELGAVPGMTIHLIGGRFRLANLDFIGAETVVGFHHLRADIAFLGVDSLVPGRGAFCIDHVGSEVSVALAGCADRIVTILDHSKFHVRGHWRILEPNKIDTLITDAEVSDEIKEQLAGEPYKVIFAEPK